MHGWKRGTNRPYHLSKTLTKQIRSNSTYQPVSKQSIVYLSGTLECQQAIT